MRYLDNWEYDLYMRIDQEQRFDVKAKTDYLSEITWCYRFGFIDEEHRDKLQEYLLRKINNNEFEQGSYMLDRKEAMEQRQRILDQQRTMQREIKELFVSMLKAV